MRLNQYNRCLLSLQGKSPLAVSQGYQPEPNHSDTLKLILGCVAILFLMVMA